MRRAGSSRRVASRIPHNLRARRRLAPLKGSLDRPGSRDGSCPGRLPCHTPPGSGYRDRWRRRCFPERGHVSEVEILGGSAPVAANLFPECSSLLEVRLRQFVTWINPIDFPEPVLALHV